MNTGLKNNSHVYYESLRELLQVDGRKLWMEARLGRAETLI